MKHSLWVAAFSISSPFSPLWGGSRIWQRGLQINGRRKREPLGGSGGMITRKVFNCRTSEMRFSTFSGAIWSGLIVLRYIYWLSWFTFFLISRLSHVFYLFTFSLGGSTEPPEPPLDPPLPLFLTSSRLTVRRQVMKENAWCFVEINKSEIGPPPQFRFSRLRAWEQLKFCLRYVLSS